MTSSYKKFTERDAEFFPIFRSAEKKFRGTNLGAPRGKGGKRQKNQNYVSTRKKYDNTCLG